MPEQPHELLSDQLHSEQISTPLIQVGALLREAREAKGASIAEIAGSLRMGQEQLLALENGNKDALPEPVFIRAMVRRVAERLDLDANPLVQQIQVLSQSIPKKPSQSKGKASSSKLRIVPVLACLGGLVGITATGLAIVYHNSPNTFNRIQRSFNNSSSGIISWSSNKSNDSQVESNKSTPFVPQSVVSSPAQALPSTSPTPPENKAGIPFDKFEVSSKEPSWVSIRNAEGDIIFEGTLSEPLSYSSDEHVEIYAGRPDLILISRNGEAPTPLGTIRDVHWHKLNRRTSNP